MGMSISDAIKHCEEVAEEHTKYNFYGGYESCDECASEHRQLAEWLRELKAYKEQQPCEDCISRKEALKVMCDKCPMYNCVTSCSSYRHIEKLPSLTPKARWIPVSERLPEEKGEYLVTYHPCYWDDVLQDIKVGLDTFRGKKWAKVKYQRVIAWMPLPQPYEEVNNADKD